MRIAWLLIYLYGLSFSTAHAATLIDLGSSNCSGSQSFDLSNGLSFSCSGDFSLSAGSLSSDTGIILSSLGSLTLDAFTLSAPSITLNATSIFIKSNASLTGDLIELSATNTIVINSLISPGSSIQILPGRDIIPPPNPPLVDTTITLLPGGDVSNGSGIHVPPISTPNPGGEILIAHGGDITVIARPSSPPIVNIPALGGNILLTPHTFVGPITSVPLPASLTMLLTGLLTLLSVSGRSHVRNVR